MEGVEVDRVELVYMAVWEADSFGPVPQEPGRVSPALPLVQEGALAVGDPRRSRTAPRDCRPCLAVAHHLHLLLHLVLMNVALN